MAKGKKDSVSNIKSRTKSKAGANQIKKVTEHQSGSKEEDQQSQKKEEEDFYEQTKLSTDIMMKWIEIGRKKKAHISQTFINGLPTSQKEGYKCCKLLEAKQTTISCSERIKLDKYGDLMKDLKILHEEDYKVYLKYLRHDYIPPISIGHSEQLGHFAFATDFIKAKSLVCEYKGQLKIEPNDKVEDGMLSKIAIKESKKLNVSIVIDPSDQYESNIGVRLAGFRKSHKGANMQAFKFFDENAGIPRVVLQCIKDISPNDILYWNYSITDGKKETYKEEYIQSIRSLRCTINVCPIHPELDALTGKALQRNSCYDSAIIEDGLTDRNGQATTNCTSLKDQLASSSASVASKEFSQEILSDDDDDEHPQQVGTLNGIQRIAQECFFNTAILLLRIILSRVRSQKTDFILRESPLQIARQLNVPVNIYQQGDMKNIFMQLCSSHALSDLYAEIAQFITLKRTCTKCRKELVTYDQPLITVINPDNKKMSSHFDKNYKTFKDDYECLGCHQRDNDYSIIQKIYFPNKFGLLEVNERGKECLTPFTLQLQDSGRFFLLAFIIHEGVDGNGHYKTFFIENGRFYCLNDDMKTEIGFKQYKDMAVSAVVYLYMRQQEFDIEFGKYFSLNKAGTVKWKRNHDSEISNENFLKFMKNYDINQLYSFQSVLSCVTSTLQNGINSCSELFCDGILINIEHAQKLQRLDYQKHFSFPLAVVFSRQKKEEKYKNVKNFLKFKKRQPLDARFFEQLDNFLKDNKDSIIQLDVTQDFCGFFYHNDAKALANQLATFANGRLIGLNKNYNNTNTVLQLTYGIDSRMKVYNKTIDLIQAGNIGDFIGSKIASLINQSDPAMYESIASSWDTGMYRLEISLRGKELTEFIDVPVIQQFQDLFSDIADALSDKGVIYTVQTLDLLERLSNFQSFSGNCILYCSKEVYFWVIMVNAQIQRKATSKYGKATYYGCRLPPMDVNQLVNLYAPLNSQTHVVYDKQFINKGDARIDKKNGDYFPPVRSIRLDRDMRLPIFWNLAKQVGKDASVEQTLFNQKRKRELKEQQKAKAFIAQNVQSSAFSQVQNTNLLTNLANKAPYITQTHRPVPVGLNQIPQKQTPQLSPSQFLNTNQNNDQYKPQNSYPTPLLQPGSQYNDQPVHYSPYSGPPTPDPYSSLQHGVQTIQQPTQYQPTQYQPIPQQPIPQQPAQPPTPAFSKLQSPLQPPLQPNHNLDDANLIPMKKVTDQDDGESQQDEQKRASKPIQKEKSKVQSNKKTKSSTSKTKSVAKSKPKSIQKQKQVSSLTCRGTGHIDHCLNECKLTFNQVFGPTNLSKDQAGKYYANHTPPTHDARYEVRIFKCRICNTEITRRDSFIRHGKTHYDVWRPHFFPGIKVKKQSNK